MKKYYCEITFTWGGFKYYLPLFLEGESLGQAQQQLSTVKYRLEEHGAVLNVTGPTYYKDGFNEILDDSIKRRLSINPTILYVQRWTFKNLIATRPATVTEVLQWAEEKHVPIEWLKNTTLHTFPLWVSGSFANPVNMEAPFLLIQMVEPTE